MADYQSHNTGEEIDAAIDRIKNKEIDDLADAAAKSALSASVSATSAAQSAASALESKNVSTEQAALSTSSAARAELAATRAPYISERNTWMKWDPVLGAYVDTGVVAAGARGPTGETGPVGPVGPIGPKGETGLTGPTGPIGETGPKGETGDVGPIGPVGPIGQTGPQGIQGVQGPVGPKGDKGDKGDKGETGKGLDIRGYYDTVEALISADPDHNYMYGVGLIAPFDIWDWDSIHNEWVNNGILQGADGKSAYQVAVDGGFVGTVSEWLASLKGERGETGPQGVQGIPGPQGDRGETGEKGNQGDIGPQGPQGITGPKGDPGPNAVSFSVTLSAGGWSNGLQTVSDARLIVDGYSYIVSPDDDSFLAYSSAMIRANDIEQAGKITFTAAEAPSVSLLVNIVRIEVS